MTQPDEQVLAEGGVTRVVRVEDTARRPVRPFTATVQAYLAHLRTRGADFVPEPRGYDDRGREVLGFVPGDVPVEPLPDWATGEVVVVELARLIRRLHDAAARWVVPPDAVWGRIPGGAPLDVPLSSDAPELVSHRDYCPGNVVFRDQQPVALIDFDLAGPTSRVADCVNAMYWWVPLLDPVDRAPSLAGAEAAERVQLFADAYGMTDRQRRQVVPAAVARARNTHISMRAAADVDPVFKRWWEEGVKHRVRVNTQQQAGEPMGLLASRIGAQARRQEQREPSAEHLHPHEPDGRIAAARQDRGHPHDSRQLVVGRLAASPPRGRLLRRRSVTAAGAAMRPGLHPSTLASCG